MRNQKFSSSKKTEKNIRPIKRFGQNFLRDQNVLEQIVKAAELTVEDEVIEIGMGEGVLTKKLAPQVPVLFVFEIDKRLFSEIVPEIKRVYPHVFFIQGDFLEEAGQAWNKIKYKAKVVANIPYNITAPIIENLIDNRHKLQSAVLMVQKEVAARLVAHPSEKAYGSLSLFVQYYLDVEKVIEVSKRFFYPVPKVDSTVIKLIPLKKPRVIVSNEEKLFKLIRGAFWGRRKTLRNSLKQSPFTHYTNEMLDKIEKELLIDLNRRGETLSLQEFGKIANLLFTPIPLS